MGLGKIRSFTSIQLLGFIAVFVIMVTLPITVYVAQQQQTFHQHAQTMGAATISPFPNCQYGTTTPIGQSNPSAEAEPLGAIWCFPLTQEPTTRVTGTNDWVDEFQTNVPMGQFGEPMPQSGFPNGNGYYGWKESSSMDYRIFNNLLTANQNNGLKTQGFINNNHWMFDMCCSKTEGGVLVSPNKSFKFENGKLVVEADVAAAIGDYPGGGADVFPEIDITNSPSISIGKSQTELSRSCGVYASDGAGVLNFNNNQWQTGVCKPADTLYGYGDFPGYWAFGCRLQNTKVPVCSLYHPTGYSGCVGVDVPEGDNCVNGMRVYEFNPTEVGIHVNEFNLAGVPDQQSVWRTCQSNQMDMFCRDRFRLEITKSDFTLFVNGVKYFQISVKPGATIAGLPQGQIFPDELLNGNNYVYYTSWTSAFNPNTLTRFHWGRVAVNPHNPDGSILAASASPSYCPGQPQNTCPMDRMAGSPTMMPSVMMQSPTPTTPMPTSTPTSTPGSAPTPTPTFSPSVIPPANGGLLGNATIEPSVDTSSQGEAEAFQYQASATGTTNALSVYFDQSNTSQQVLVGLYSDSNGTPGTLLSQEIISNPINGTWNTVNIPQVQLTAGTKYWIAILGLHGTVTFRDQPSGSTPSQSSQQTALTALPLTWTSGATWTSSSMSVYATTQQVANTPTPLPTTTVPTTSDIILGMNTLGSVVDNNDQGQAEAFAYTASVTKSSSKASVYIDGSNAASQVIVGVYMNTGSNNPGTLLGQATITNPTSGAWNTVSLSQVAITNGQKYWIAILSPSGTDTVWFRDRNISSGLGSQSSQQTTLTSLPGTWTKGVSWSSGFMSAYLQ